MKRAWRLVRSVFFWAVSVLHFFTVGPALILLSFFVDPRKNDRVQRVFMRNALRLAGVRFEVRYAPGFDRTRTSFLVCNHVNLFDAFVIYSAIPQFVRGWELESHFEIPVYGWFMKRFGNVPVPVGRKASDLKRMLLLTRRALDSGISLIAFPEGSRTLTGRVGSFHRGVFNMAIALGYPIVPMSIVGSFEFNRKGSWMLNSAKIVVYMHDTIETAGMTRDQVDELRDRVHAVVSRPVDEHMAAAERR